MRLPRRVPWATVAELDQLCSWVYAADAHDSSRNLAIERLSAWRFMMPLPHALESLLSILVAIQQDNASSGAGPSCSLSLRQSYATALIRLVNGLVDPLQAGTYARSILSIAAQIGLPAWLVELRHAATHEDLPSLELLRDGAKESLGWLLQNYFLPTLNPASALAPSSSSSASTIRPVAPLLRRYKSLLKTVSRDASLRTRHAVDISGALREIERWLAEARVAAHTHASEFASWLPYYRERRHAGEEDESAVATAQVEDNNEEDEDVPEPTEAWALDRLCDALLVKGALVPLSRKKRISPQGSAQHYPPSPLLAIWFPLLESVVANHEHFPTVLTSHIIARLLAHDVDPSNKRDIGDDNDGATTTAAAAAEKTSYDVCLAAWGAWLVEWRRAHDSEADVSTRRQDVFFQLVQALAAHAQRREAPSPSCSQTGARAMLTALCASDKRLAEISPAILGATHIPEDAPAWCEADLNVMEAREKAARSLSASTTNNIQPCAEAPLPEEQGLSDESKNLPDGWHLLSERGGWRTCPIGVYVGCE